jgi:hypothetical protein
MPATPEFKDRLQKITLRNAKAKHTRHKSWPIEKKIEVVSQFLVLGNMKMVAATTGVSHDLIRQWKTQSWWSELEAEIRQTQNIEMDTKLSKIVDKSLDAVLDRVENGDYFYDQKEKKIKRKPVALRDVARVSVDMISKRELIRGNATERKETTQISVNEQLKLLAQEFAKWTSGKKPEVIELNEEDVTDVTIKEPADALYDQREERLQEGESVVQQPTGGSEEEGGEEFSPETDGERREGS